MVVVTAASLQCWRHAAPHRINIKTCIVYSNYCNIIIFHFLHSIKIYVCALFRLRTKKKTSLGIETAIQLVVDTSQGPVPSQQFRSGKISNSCTKTATTVTPGPTFVAAAYQQTLAAGDTRSAADCGETWKHVGVWARGDFGSVSNTNK